jgi:coenzyme F420-dependent glucose-6-phosphate dehydrogenase
MIALEPQVALVEAFEGAGGSGKPKVAQVHVCWAEDESQARRTAARWWAHQALPGALTTELARPKDFQRATALVTEDAIADAVVCGPDLDRHLEAVARFAGAGFDRVYVHQVGPDQAGFLRTYQREVLPRFDAASR